MKPGEVEPGILYAEVPGFYAEVERRDDPDLAARAVLVGGDPSKSGKVQSASPEAVASGALPGMPMSEALRHCPGAIRVPTNMKRYREASGALAICLRRVVDEIEQAGFGAAYVDVRERAEPPARLAARMIAAARDDLGLPLRVGIAPTKLLAKLAAEEAGADGLRCVHSGEVAAFLHPLPLGRLPKVGRKTEAALHELGAACVGDLLALEREPIEQALGNHGLAVLEMARGRDHAPVRVARHPASISRERRLGGAGQADVSLADVARQLARSVSTTLERQGLRARRVALRLRFQNQTTTTRSATLGHAVLEAAEIYSVLQSLLERVGGDVRVVQSIGVTLAGLTVSGEEDRQLELFSPSG